MEVNLSREQLATAPDEVVAFWLLACNQGAVSKRTMDRMVEQYPEYFPEEIERRRKLDLVPAHVHEEFSAACHQVSQELFGTDFGFKLGGGLLWNINHQLEAKAFAEEQAPLRAEYERRVAEIDKKFYQPYGLSR